MQTDEFKNLDLDQDLYSNLDNLFLGHTKFQPNLSTEFGIGKNHV